MRHMLWAGALMGVLAYAPRAVSSEVKAERMDAMTTLRFLKLVFPNGPASHKGDGPEYMVTLDDKTRTRVQLQRPIRAVWDDRTFLLAVIAFPDDEKQATAFAQESKHWERHHLNRLVIVYADEAPPRIVNHVLDGREVYGATNSTQVRDSIGIGKPQIVLIYGSVHSLSHVREHQNMLRVYDLETGRPLLSLVTQSMISDTRAHTVSVFGSRAEFCDTDGDGVNEVMHRDMSDCIQKTYCYEDGQFVVSDTNPIKPRNRFERFEARDQHVVVRGQVVDADGAPIPRAHVGVMSSTVVPDFEGLPQQHRQTAKTDEDGRFEVGADAHAVFMTVAAIGFRQKRLRFGSPEDASPFPIKPLRILLDRK